MVKQTQGVKKLIRITSFAGFDSSFSGLMSRGVIDKVNGIFTLTGKGHKIVNTFSKETITKLFKRKK